MKSIALFTLFLAIFASCPFPSKAQLSGPTPPRDTPLKDISADSVPNEGISEKGRMALAIKPDKWKTAETPNFYIHYRRQTEARKVAREVEFDLFIIAQTLGAQPASYAKKSHAYVFEDEAEWHGFTSTADMPEWTSSFAYGDELFLNVREQGGPAPFDSRTLAHETTHAVVARIYGPQKRWPLWASEGFAEYMGGAAVAARKNQTLKRNFTPLFTSQADVALSVEELEKLTSYPEKGSVHALYESGEAAVRVLMSNGPPARFVQLVDQLIAGKKLAESVPALYPDKFKDFDAFNKAYKKMTNNQ